jgi:hypothetical protein
VQISAPATRLKKRLTIHIIAVENNNNAKTNGMSSHGSGCSDEKADEKFDARISAPTKQNKIQTMRMAIHINDI